MTIAVNEKVDILINELIKKFPVNEVYLFGSYAKGKQDEESDIDFCIIVNEYKERKIEMLRNARRLLSTHTEKSLDLLLYTKSEFYTRANSQLTSA